MPEGDTIHYAANRIRPVLEGRTPDAVLTPHPRFGADRWPERLAGRAVEEVRAYGKHLFLRWEGDLVLHSHLRMTGAWQVVGQGVRWRRSPRRAWFVARADAHEVVQFDGPVLELLTETRRRFDHRLRTLGPDILGPEFDERRFLHLLRGDDPTRPFGDALLDQHTIAGIGNLWKAEACFAAAVDPWRPTGAVGDDEALGVVRAARERMQRSAAAGKPGREQAVYGRAGRPCPRCGAPIQQRGQGEGNRPTYWCASCQR